MNLFGSVLNLFGLALIYVDKVWIYLDQFWISLNHFSIYLAQWNLNFLFATMNVSFILVEKPKKERELIFQRPGGLFCGRMKGLHDKYAGSCRPIKKKLFGWNICLQKVFFCCSFAKKFYISAFRHKANIFAYHSLPFHFLQFKPSTFQRSLNPTDFE